MTRFLMSASLLAISSSALAVSAAAQTLPTDPHDHDDIVTTGVLADSTTDELIANISVIDREEIVRDLKTTLGDSLDREPGVSTTFFGAGASRPVLRGLGSERVLVLTNGIGAIDVSAASQDHQVTADGIDATRIEILRGPAALAYGGQAIGGVVNVIDGLIAEQMPETEGGLPLEADAFAAYNTAFDDGLEGAARIQGGLETGNGALVVTGSVSARDFGDYDIPGSAESPVQLAFEGEEGEDEEVLENSFVETLTLAGGASYVFDTASGGGFIGAAIRDTGAEYGLPGGHEEGEEGEGEPGEEEEEEVPFIDLDQTRYDIRGGLDFETGFISGVRANVAIADYFHTEFEAPGEAGTTYDREGVEGRAAIRTRAGVLNGTIGAQFLDSSLESVGEEAFITPTDTSSIAVFAFQRFKDEADLFSVEGGVRVEQVEYDNEFKGDTEFDLISASAGAHFHPVEPVFLGAEISYTERAPNESELYSDGVHLATGQFEVGRPTLAEERGINYELTARYDMENVRIGANAFLTDFDNFTTLLPGTTAFEGEIVDEVEGFPVFVFEQDGADFLGGEIYAEVDVDAGFTEIDLRASVDYVEGELDGGQNVPLLPPLTFNVSGAAEFGIVGVSGALTVADDQNDPGLGDLRTDGYTNLDLGAFISVDDYIGAETAQVFVQVRNVLDEDIRFASSVLKDSVPAPGRNVRIGVRAGF